MRQFVRFRLSRCKKIGRAESEFPQGTRLVAPTDCPTNLVVELRHLKGLLQARRGFQCIGQSRDPIAAHDDERPVFALQPLRGSERRLAVQIYVQEDEVEPLVIEGLLERFDSADSACNNVPRRVELIFQDHREEAFVLDDQDANLGWRIRHART